MIFFFFLYPLYMLLFFIESFFFAGLLVVPEILCIDAKQPNHDLTVAVEVLRDTNLVSEVKEDIFWG